MPSRARLDELRDLFDRVSVPDMILWRSLATPIVCTFLSSGCSAGASPDPLVSVYSFGDDAAMPAVVSDGTGNLDATFIAGDNLYYSRSSDGGRSFGPRIQVNYRQGFVAGGLFRGPELARSSDGVVHIVWNNRALQLGLPHDQSGVMYSRLKDGGLLGAERNLTRGPVDGYSIAANGASVKVAWHTDNEVLIANPGAAVDLPVAAPVAGLLPCECCDTATMQSTNGAVTLVYRDRLDNRRDMYLVRLAPDGALRSRLKLDRESWILEGCPISGVALLRNDTADLVAWEHEGRILLASVPDGAVETPPAMDLGAGKFPVMAASAGRILIAFNARRVVEWILLDGKSLNQLAASSVQARQFGRPAAAGLPGGRFLVVP